MHKPRTKTEALKVLVRKQRLIRTADLNKLEIDRKYLERFVSQGLLVKLQRGLYAAPDSNLTENRGLLEVTRKVPKAVICLLSALRFHEVTTQSPHEVWVALDVRSWKPTLSYPPIRWVRLSGRPLEFGVREHIIDGVKLRVYSPAKTVADCFKFRNKIGLDIAIEALREVYRQKKATTDELWEAAKVCRVSKVMLPYMESLV
jgi:predicted transcriptional regulator of viral defense system